jgi:glycerophosphoryl diester phosphodiesterase
MLAFERARSEGARAIELDVRTSADGRVVVFHDPALARMTEGRDARRVDDVTLAELRRIDLGAGGTNGTGARVPELAEVLGWAADHGVAVNVELKYDVPRLAEVARATARVVRAARADVLFSSFDPRLLAWAAQGAPRVPRALITHERQARAVDVLRELLRGPLARLVPAIHLELAEATGEAIDRYRRRGLRVGVWTVNEPAAAVRLAAMGVGSIITDTPGAALAAITARS